MSSFEPFDRQAYVARVRSSPCFICEIVAGNPDYAHHVIYEDDRAIVFLNKYPALYGHTLVAPREHREQVTADFTAEEYVSLQRLIYRVGEAIRQIVPTERLYIVSLGSQQGNRHVHWHLAPLPPDVPYDEQQLAALSLDRGILTMSDEQTVALAEQIRQALRGGEGRPDPVFVLLHSPLGGPFIWSLVAEELRLMGAEVVVPTLRSDPAQGKPYWRQHVDAVARALEGYAPRRRLILVGHSGAGVLLPAIRAVTGRPVAGYIFVDATVPVDGKSRLDFFEVPEAVAEFRRNATNGQVSPWSDADLEDLLPEAPRRERLIAELRPIPLEVFEEPLPVFQTWPDAPCGYLRLGLAYGKPAEQARQAGWALRELKGLPFHMLVDPAAVADALAELVDRMGIQPE